MRGDGPLGSVLRAGEGLGDGVNTLRVAEGSMPVHVTRTKEASGQAAESRLRAKQLTADELAPVRKVSTRAGEGAETCMETPSWALGGDLLGAAVDAAAAAPEQPAAAQPTK